MILLVSNGNKMLDLRGGVAAGYRDYRLLDPTLAQRRKPDGQPRTDFNCGYLS